MNKNSNILIVIVIAAAVFGLLLTRDGEPETVDQEQETVEETTTDQENLLAALSWDVPPDMTIDPSKEYYATLNTSKGVIKVKLFASETPETVNNFVFLAKEDYYSDTKFHRVIDKFMIQGGDPTGTGRGGPGYTFDDEAVTRDYVRGVIAMANAGPNTNGSQFFIMQQDLPLPKSYTIFGEVVEGMETVDAIAETPVGPSGTGEQSSPLEDIILNSVTIEEK